MDCPDCGTPMIVVKTEIKGDDTFHTIETWYSCPQCDEEVKTERGNSNNA